jgi:hypothetical protein
MSSIPATVTCSICLEDLNQSSSEPSRALACMHVFHANCVNPWLENHNTCPTCRAVAPVQAIYQRVVNPQGVHERTVVGRSSNFGDDDVGIAIINHFPANNS